MRSAPMERTEFYQDAYEGFPGPLTGVRVLEATTTWAGPLCGCILGDFGADVIKVEIPGGEIGRRLPPFLPGLKKPVSIFHATVNRNKRSLTLDLRLPQGRDIFLRLAEGSDIVLENFRPGTMNEWGLGYAAVRERKADIIYVSISGARAGARDVAERRAGGRIVCAYHRAGGKILSRARTHPRGRPGPRRAHRGDPSRNRDRARRGRFSARTRNRLKRLAFFSIDTFGYNTL